MSRPRLAPALALVAAAATTLVAAALPGGSAQAASSSAGVPMTSPVKLISPTKVVNYKYGSYVEFDPRMKLLAGTAPFELWSTKASFRAPIITEWRSSAGTGTLPAGTETDFLGLPGFLRFTIKDHDGNVVRTLRRKTCLNGDGNRARPDAPLTSPYPYGCAYGTLTQGFVQGVQAGWANNLYAYGSPFRLAAGHYEVTAYIPAIYRDAFHITREDGFRTFELEVVDSEYVCRGCRTTPGSRTASGDGDLVPAATEPSTESAGEPGETMPDLRSLPAFGFRISPSGNFLMFSANVWNGGNSPLVVDGFRRDGEDIMDAYQYFVDADGNQTGFQQVGTMAWDSQDTHQHWHFKDFARYRILNEDKTQAVRSRKEAFCLANTDAIDYTLPGADWRPDQTDLHTACGERDSLSIREVLSAGSGDTYAQYRAGQSFDLRGLPNGVYYVAVEANPMGRLVESDTTNNVALRKVTIGGVPGARTVKAGPR